MVTELSLSKFDGELTKVRNFLLDMPDEFVDPVVEEGLLRGARVIANEAKSKAPVVSGTYRNGIKARKAPGGRRGRGPRPSEVRGTAPYSHILEFGGLDGTPKERNILSNALLDTSKSGELTTAVAKRIQSAIVGRIKRLAAKHGLTSVAVPRF